MSTAPVAEKPAPPSEGLRARLGSRDGALAVLIGLIVVGAVLRFWRLGHQSFWFDESLTVSEVRHSFGQMLALERHAEGTPPLYFSLAWIWGRIFGFGEAGIRSLSAVAGVGAIPVVHYAGARLMSRRAGLVAAALLACNPLLVWYSQEARSYSLLVLTASLSLLAFAHLLTAPPSGRRVAAWALVAILAIATHYYAVLIVAPETLWLLWVHRRAPSMWLAVYAVAAVGVLLMWFAQGQLPADWITGAPLGLRLGQIPPQFLLGMGAPGRPWLKLAALLVLCVAGLGLVARADARERRGALQAGSLAAAGFVLSLLLALAGFDKIITRNLIVVLLGVILLVAGGLGARRWATLGVSGAAVLCAIGIASVLTVAVDESFQRAPWREVARVLSADRAAGAASAILVENSDSTMPIDDYLQGLSVLVYGARVRELDIVAAVSEPKVAFCWWGAACSLPLAPLDTSIRIPGFEASGPVTHVQGFSIYRLRAARPVFLTRQEVAGALSGARLRSYGLFVQPPG